jgi:hypothetical protein
VALDVDPSAAQLLELISELAQAQAVIHAQRRRLWALASTLAATQAALCRQADLVDVLLATEPGDG